MRAQVIHHFGQNSRDLVCSEFPSIAGRNHVVHKGFNYERLLAGKVPDRVAARQTFGFSPDEIVFLVLGDLRFWEEVRLLWLAFDLARVPRKRLLLAARYHSGSSWRERC